jgi:hypothetical protein
MSLCELGLLPAAWDDISLIEGMVVAKSFEMIEVFGDFCQLQSALNIGFGVKVGFGLRGVGVHLLIGVNYLVMGNAESVDIGGDSLVIEFSSGSLDKGISGWVPSKKVEQPSGKGLDWRRGVRGGSVHIGNGGGAGTKIGVT